MMSTLQAKKHKQTNDKQAAMFEREMSGMARHKQTVNVNKQGYARQANKGDVKQSYKCL